MSKLNANAFAFVPGQAFRVPQPAAQVPPPPAPIERPEPAEAPAKPPTISLNIGGSKPVAPVPAPAPAVPAAAPTAPATSAAATPARVSSPTPETSGTSTPAKAPAATKASSKAQSGSSTTFSLERAKNDTAAVAQEVQNAVDEATLKDLFGNGMFRHIYDLDCTITTISRDQSRSI